MTRHLFRIADGPDTVIAESEEHAWEVWAEATDPDCVGELKAAGERWEEVPDYQRIEVGFECPDDIRNALREAEQSGCDMRTAIVTVRCHGLSWLAGSRPEECRQAISAPARWWARMPSGLLCSEDT